jgi:O-antigen/teichoic acid export membrane protein
MRVSLDSPTECLPDVPAGLPLATSALAVANPRGGAAVRAARQGGAAVLDQAVFSGTNFLTAFVLGRLWDQKTFGVYFLATTVVLFILNIQDRLISTPYTIHYSRRNPEAWKAYTSSVLLHQLVLCASVGLALLVLAVIVRACGVQDLWPLIYALTGALPLLMLRFFVRLLLVAHLEMTAAVVVDVFVAALQLGGLLALRTVGGLSVPVAFLVIGGANGAAVIAWFAIKRPPLSFSPRRAFDDWLHNWSFGKWVAASFLASSLAVYAGPWILNAHLGKTAAAMLGACTYLIGVANMFAAGLDSYLTPKTARAYSQHGLAGLTGVLWKSTVFLTILLGSLCVFFYFGGELVAAIVYNGKYPGAGRIVTLLALAVLVNTLGNSAGRGLWVLNRPSSNLLPDAAMSIVTLAVILALVQPLGVLGAALASVAGSLAGASLRIWSFARLLRSVRLGAGMRRVP